MKTKLWLAKLNLKSDFDFFGHKAWNGMLKTWKEYEITMKERKWDRNGQQIVTVHHIMQNRAQQKMSMEHEIEVMEEEEI